VNQSSRKFTLCTLNCNAQINSKLQHPPPGYTPGIWLCIVPREGGIWTLRWKGGEFEPDFSCSDVIRPRVFSVFAGMTDFQDRISPLLVNNSFKRSLKVSLRHISLWKAWTVFDCRRNLSLRSVISVLVGGEFERLFCPEGREFEQANLQKFKCPGGMLNFRIDRRINCSVGQWVTNLIKMYELTTWPSHDTSYIRSLDGLLKFLDSGFIVF